VGGVARGQRGREDVIAVDAHTEAKFRVRAPAPVSRGLMRLELLVVSGLEVVEPGVALKFNASTRVHRTCRVRGRIPLEEGRLT